LTAGALVTPPRDRTIHDDILAALRAARVTLAASLPDDWMAPIISSIDEDPTIDHVRVAREPEIIGICSGAFLGGRRAVGVMGATGFLTCACELATLALRFQIPLFLLVSMRGGPYETAVYQETQWRTARPVAEALDMLSIVIDTRDKISQIPQAYESLRLHKRPCVAWIPKNLLTGTPSME
jgi:sulfopyruvate decarboxylase TPP-binding subunit